ncbi:MAG: LapA family protein [Smithella sp.]|nr:LapA family protein [Smithella sp.]
MNYKIGLIAILLFVALIFLAQNIEVVTVSFLLWEVSMSLPVMISFLLLTGVLMGWFLHSYLTYRKNKKKIL